MNPLEPFTERSQSAAQGFDKLSPNGFFKFEDVESIAIIAIKMRAISALSISASGHFCQNLSCDRHAGSFWRTQLVN